MNVVSVVKTGRCSNGAERDHGSVRHAMDAERYHWGAMGKALCGAQPGRRSVGFVSDEGRTEITCARCKGKADKAGAVVIDVSELPAEKR